MDNSDNDKTINNTFSNKTVNSSNAVTNNFVPSPTALIVYQDEQSKSTYTGRLTRKFSSEGHLQIANSYNYNKIADETKICEKKADDFNHIGLTPIIKYPRDPVIRSGSAEPRPGVLFESTVEITSCSNSGGFTSNRQSYNLPEFNEQYEVIKGSQRTSLKMGNKVVSFLKPHFSVDYINRKLVKLFPILAWLRNYNVRKNLIVDIIAGLTILVFQVPQSMGYSLIARVPPVHGLYTSFFPALVYSFMGTSRHCAVGTFAVVSLMTGSLIAQVLEPKGFRPVDKPEEAVEIAIAISFLIGLYQLVFGIFRLGFFSVYMSEQLISGFTTACSFYVFTSQISYLFGLHLPYRSGPLALIYTYKDLVCNFDAINVPTLIISVTCCLIILAFKFVINPLLARHTSLSIPFPIELVLVILSTVISDIFTIRERWGVQVVGPIPRGLPLPQHPRLDLIRELAISTIPLAIVAYSLTISVGKIFANRHKYKVDPNQELLALGTTNLISCLFSCIPSAASLSRSAVQESSGGRTQLVSLVNCVGLLFVLLYAGPLLSELPNCVLAAIIVVALKTLLIQVKDFANYWRISKLDASIWLITFFAVILLDVDIGLYVGLGYSLLTLIYKSQRPKIYLLGFVNNSDVYVPVNRYASANEIPGVKIYQFCGPLHFANIEYFHKGLARKTGVSVKGVLTEKKRRKKRDKKWSTCELTHRLDLVSGLDGFDGSLNSVIPVHLSHIIIDCSMFSYIDVTGVRQLRSTIQEYAHIGVETFLACVATHVQKMLEKDGFFIDIPPSHVYLTIHDAADNALKVRQSRFKSSKGSQSSSLNGSPSCSTFTLNHDGNADDKDNIEICNEKSEINNNSNNNNNKNHLQYQQFHQSHHQHPKQQQQQQDNHYQRTSKRLSNRNDLLDHENHSHEDDLSEKSKFLCCPKAHSP
ncbi:solute carrier family 26 member 6 [Tetranychus urticae]|uniref:STAS domain-containing protein n=1 Tax=Tetranychus urticae TaxID=32264 RepID=T1KQK3_TETUR|nr:solute carrier family 26 member 6 [Tetranychus urticae]